MISKPLIWLAVVVAQASMSAALAANIERVDYSCPTSPNDQPANFPEGAVPLTFPGVVHIEDHSQDYRLTFSPAPHSKGGYVSTILIVGHKYTLDPVTQKKTYVFGKDAFRQRIVDIPINYCRGRRVSYSMNREVSLGMLDIADGSGRTIAARAVFRALKSCDENGCDVSGLVAGYKTVYSTLTNVTLGENELGQDIRIMKPAP